MTIEEKLLEAYNLQKRLERVNKMLKHISYSREKADKKKGIEKDSYPEYLCLKVWHCTGSSGSAYGDTYDEGIKDESLLIKLFAAIEPTLAAEKELIEMKLNALIG